MNFTTRWEVLPVGQILYDEDFNCRNPFTMASVKSLAESIARDGLDTPVAVRPYTTSPFQLIAGFRRYTACVQLLKWSEIPTKIYEGLTDEQAAALNFRENLERKDLNFLEQAQGLANMFDLWKQVEQLRACQPQAQPVQWNASLRYIKSVIHQDERWIHKRLKLLTLPDEVQQQAAAGLLTPENIEIVWSRPTRKAQIDTANAIASVKARGGRTRSLRHLNPVHRSTFRRPATKSRLREMVATMLDLGVEGLGPRALTWAAGLISDDELREDIKEQLCVQKRLESVVSKCLPKTPRRKPKASPSRRSKPRRKS